MSGIRMDHYLEVDFTGFKKIIDDLGGVEVTTGKPIKDGASHLDLPAGTNRLDGEQALGLVRTRKSVGDGSDLGRIQLQQAFIKALIKQVKGIGLFDNPKKLLDLADSGTKAVTTDKALGDVKSLMGFAQSLQGIGAQDMQMITLPVTADPRDPDRVAPLPKETRLVWEALLADRPIPPRPPSTPWATRAPPAGSSARPSLPALPGPGPPGLRAGCGIPGRPSPLREAYSEF